MERRILMLTMSLGIGGAETHIVELCRVLAGSGIHVCAASNGGVYADRLREYGITHHDIPLHSRRLADMFSCLRAICRIIREERIDVVHAHARIPAFIAGIACRLTGTPLVTTVHGAYSTAGMLRYLTNWGKRSLVVSNDLTAYLTDEYGVPPARIKVTVNGIDTSRFVPSAPDVRLASQLGIDMNVPRVMHLGRLDSDSGQYAFELLSHFSELDEAVPGVQLIIVGAGPLLPEAEALADGINAGYGARRVVMTGGRTDINELIPLCSCLVALSRAALEGMSCGVPVVLAGFYGYAGLFDGTKLSECINNNFTARGFGHVKADVLIRDVAQAVGMSFDMRDRLAVFERGVVVDNYSLERMARDATEVYRLFPTKRRGRKIYDFCLLGYYGYSNSGDDALLASILGNLRAQCDDLSFCVLSNQVKRCSDEFCCRSMHRFNVFSVFRALRRSKVFVFGGGNLMQDITSAQSLVYYSCVLRMAQLLGLSTMLYANGIGPLMRPSSIRLAKSALERTDIITLREKDSLDLLTSLGGDYRRLELTADEALTLSPSDGAEVARLLEKIGLPSSRSYFCISLRPWKDADDSFYAEVAAAVDEICDVYDLSPVFVALSRGTDEDISRRTASLLANKAYVLDGASDARDIIGLFASARMVIGMRLHSLIYSVAGGTPCIGLVYDEKVRSFLDSAEVGYMLPLDKTEHTALVAMADDIMNNESDVRAAIEKRRSLLCGLANRNSSLALGLLREYEKKHGGVK